MDVFSYKKHATPYNACHPEGFGNGVGQLDGQYVNGFHQNNGKLRDLQQPVVIFKFCTCSLYVMLFSSFCPVSSVKLSVPYSLCYVWQLHIAAAVKVGDGSCHLQYAAIGACRQ